MASTREDLFWRAVTLAWVSVVGSIWITVYLVVVATIIGLAILLGLVIGREPLTDDSLGDRAERQIDWWAGQFKWALYGEGDGWFYPVPGQRTKGVL